jgi:hypothetical protein
MADPSNEQIFLALGRLEGKVDALMHRSMQIEEHLDNQDKRIRSLEQYKHFLLGISAAVGAASSFIINLIQRNLGA